MNKVTREFKLGDVTVILAKKQLEDMLEEFNKPEYPMYFKGKRNKIVVKFTGLTEGVKVIDKEGILIEEPAGTWMKHTDEGAWEQIPHNKERDLFHGQMVYCWDNNKYDYLVTLGFYDAINDCTFQLDGKLDGSSYENYSATIPEHMFTGRSRLEGIN